MSKINKNSFQKNTAPIVKLTPDQFPSLSTNTPTIQTMAWKKPEVEKQHTKVYPNGDYFDGDLDENGSSSYGTMTFENGKVYEGPFHTSWPKDMTEAPLDEEDEGYDEFHDYEAYRNDYGTLTDPDGKTFVGLFCWGRGW
jgi:hypothetical protein